jgi:hypothetical protein
MLAARLLPAFWAIHLRSEKLEAIETQSQLKFFWWEQEIHVLCRDPFERPVIMNIHWEDRFCVAGLQEQLL